MMEAVARSSIGGLTYLAPSGSLADEAGRAALAETITSCIDTNRIHVVLDLDRVSLIDGKAIEIILDANARLAFLGGRLQFVNPLPLVKDILIATGIIDEAPESDGELSVVHSVGKRAPPLDRKKLGEIAIEMGLLTGDELTEAVRLQAATRSQLGRILVERKFLSEVDLFRVLSRQMGIPYLALRPGLYEQAAIALLPRDTARRLQVLPMFKVNDTLTLATADPQAVPALDEIQELTGCKLLLVLALHEDIAKYQGEAYQGIEISPELMENMATDLEVVEEALTTDLTAIDEMAGTSPVINLVNGLIQRAVRDGASDIHIECSRNKSMVRFRIDGVLYEVMTLRADLHPAIVSRLKVMANLDIAERRMPQDGRIQVLTQGRVIDLRFSSLLGIYGEKAVLRVLDKNRSILDVEKIGMSQANLEVLKKLLGHSYGLILATGPTGSGKTTTLYAAINYLKSIEKNIVTIEDPVEYQLDIINQNQVNESIGLGFAKMLKHILRQDPDIILVGEIRDHETAEIAVQAALTGHLVLSTLHTNDAFGALNRMTDMGIEPYLLSSALVGVVAQRLVRQICPSCKTTYLPLPDVAAKYGWPDNVRLSKGRGCTACYDSGYRGRMGIHEIVESSPELQRLMIKSPTQNDLQAFAKESGYTTLFDDGLRRVLEGSTTLEEVARVIHAT